VYEFNKIRAIDMLSPSTATRVAGFFSAAFVPASVSLVHFPPFLAGRGLDGTEIGILVALPLALRVATASLLGILADRIGDRRRALAVYAGLALVGATTLWWPHDFVGLLVATAVTWAFWNGILPVSDALAVSVARRGQGDYGRMRVWGSISFVVTNLAIGGFVATHGTEVVLVLMLCGLVLQFAFAFLLPEDRAEGGAVKRVPGATRAFFRRVASDRRLAGLSIGSALLQSTHAMLYAFASLHWGTLGFSGVEIGVLWSIGVLGEILLFIFSAWVIAAIGARGLFIVGAVGAVVRWTIFPFLGPWFPAWIAVQSLHALTFAAVHIATIHLITATVEDRRGATMQGTLTSLIGLTTATATILSGPLWSAFGGRSFLMMAVVAVIGATITAIGLRTPPAQPQRAGEAGSTSDPR
jgi:PPP family 3-phenylpropionic acid transporter